MKFKKGDKVRFKKSLALGAGLQRQEQLGTIIMVQENLPAQGGSIVDIEFADSEIERGIHIHQIEHA